jgi:hypothetical protein
MAVGIYSLVFGGRRDSPIITVGVLVLSSYVFDKLLGVNYGFVEFVSVIVTCVLVLGWGQKNESIHIKYR